MGPAEEIGKLTSTELLDNLQRIEALLKQPALLEKLADKGEKLKKIKQKYEAEIAFREDLRITNMLMENLTINCAFENKVTDSHTDKICNIEKTPQKERFKPHLTANADSAQNKSQLIDLRTSLQLQIKQHEVIKKDEAPKEIASCSHSNVEESDDENGTPEEVADGEAGNDTEE